jgi:hypothetical protein
VKIAEHDHLLVIVFHHIVVDGWSIGIFCRELAASHLRRESTEPLSSFRSCRFSSATTPPGSAARSRAAASIDC